MDLFKRIKSASYLKQWIKENPASILLVMFLLIIIILTLSMEIPKTKIMPPENEYTKHQPPEIVIQ